MTEAISKAPGADLETRYFDFARACRSAASVVSLYPANHPAIRAALTRLVAATAAATSARPLTLAVLPETVQINGENASRTDSASLELADLLRRHGIAQLVLHGSPDADSWRTLLLLFARAPDEIRAEGGISELWRRAGARNVEIREIDFAEVLRERTGGGVVEMAELLASAIKVGDRLELDDEALNALHTIAQDATRLQALGSSLWAAADAAPELQASTLLRVAPVLTSFTASTTPEKLEPLLVNLAAEMARMPQATRAALIEQSTAGGASIESRDLVEGLTKQLEDRVTAGEVAQRILARQDASARLAQVLRTLELDETQTNPDAAAGAATGANAPNLGAMWETVETTLASYTDEGHVSTDYSRELSAAPTRASEIDRLSDDPPSRIRAWLTSINDAALRTLDVQLMLDLLEVETDPLRWKDVLTTVAGQIDNLALVGHLDNAIQLTHRIARHAEDPQRAPHRQFALDALQALAAGGLMRQAIAHLRATDDEGFETVHQLCHAIGPPSIPWLVMALAAEQDARARSRLQHVIVAFGERGRDEIQRLLNAENWELRRTAASLMREFGGGATVAHLEALLKDSEALVQREAVRMIALVGDDAAFDVLVRTLVSAGSRVRSALVEELARQRDPGCARLFAYLVLHLHQHGALAGTYLSAIETLGTLRAPEGIEALRDALNRGTWWAPLRTRMRRHAAAGALRRVGTPAALEVLRDAAARGSRGVRALAREQLAGLDDRKT